MSAQTTDGPGGAASLRRVLDRLEGLFLQGVGLVVGALGW